MRTAVNRTHAWQGHSRNYRSLLKLGQMISMWLSVLPAWTIFLGVAKGERTRARKGLS